MTRGHVFRRIDWEALDKTVSSLRSLKAKLRSDDVRSLAKEVLDRVAIRYAANPNHQLTSPHPEQISLLARALIDEDEDAGLAFVSRLYESGTRLEDVYLSYLAAAARLLGKWWEEDRVSFVEVTIGTARIYGILRAIDDMAAPPVLIRSKQALFISSPDETHTLGIRMAADLFRQNGWEIELHLGLSREEALARIKTAEQGIVGLTSAGQHSITELARLVLAIRIHRPELFILISGQILEEFHDVVQDMSPDAIATDIHAAIAILEEVWAQENKDSNRKS